jgi:hypothetical protein
MSTVWGALQSASKIAPSVDLLRCLFGLKRWLGMLLVETIARVRREHFIKGKTIRKIARDLKVSGPHDGVTAGKS